MSVDQTSLDRIRNATFPTSRRGYDKHEVEKFLARLADWLETGGGDESRSDAVKRELERVGERTGAILSQAEEAAQQIRGEAEAEARETIDEANAQAEKARKEADAHSGKARAEADAYAEQTRADADADAAEAIADAEAQARRIVEEATRRREDIEAVIADLVRRRDEVLDGHRGAERQAQRRGGRAPPGRGADHSDDPGELDPLKREEEPTEDEELDQEPGPTRPEPAGDEARAGPLSPGTRVGRAPA